MSGKYIGSFSPFMLTEQWARDTDIEVWSRQQSSSTSELARTEATKIKTDLKVYLTDHQTAGKGRGGNTWLNAASHSQLLSTWSLSLLDAPQQLTGPIVGLAVYKSLKATWPDLQLHLKAPNDIYLGDRKIGGILTEAITQGSTIRLLIGLGINVFSHPAEIDSSGSMSEAYSDRGDLKAQDWITFLDHLYRSLITLKGDVLNSELSETERAEILEALNAHQEIPFYKEVEADGSLVTTKGRIPWQEV